jgi:protoporphyrinogen oxidase
VDGCVVEAGPDSFIPQPWAMELIHDLGLDGTAQTTTCATTFLRHTAYADARRFT